MDKIKKVILIFLSAFILPINASAASLYLSPNSGSYEVGATFSASIYVSSPNETINAASGTVSFSTENLQVVSISKTNSIFSLWAKEPSFSNNNGTISFEGVILNPGFTGGSGKILTINFKTKKVGEENISFSSGSILANDGNGTDIISSKETAKISIIDSDAPVKEPVSAPILKIPGAPNVSSSTQPDQNKWYNSNNVKLSWETSSDINRVRILINRNPNSIPNNLIDTSIKEKEYSDLSDGVWYFHIQFRNELGWGSINHFKIQIDTVAPDPFKINIIKGKDGETSQPVVSFATTDALSGIDYYKVKIGEETPIIITEENMKNGEYTLPEQFNGSKILMVQAFDKANNYFSTAEEFAVGTLESPIITEYQKELTNTDFLNIKGTSKYPESQINLYFEKDNKTIGVKKTNTDSSGNFDLAYEGNLKNGTYNIRAEAVNKDGLKSINNNIIKVIVKDPDFIKIRAELIRIGVPLLSLILIIIIYFAYYRSNSSKRRLRKEVSEAEDIVKESFESLKKELNDKIKSLKSKTETELTQEEQENIKKMKKSIDYLEKLMKKELNDIKREVK
jgi:5-hydroxyisourate hydrolase-like protein (transthyretin family)